VLAKAALAKIVEAAEGPRDRALMETIYAVGARRSELAGMDLADVRMGDPPQLRIRKGKGRTERTCPLTAAASAAIVAYLPERLATLERFGRRGEPQ